MNANTAALLSQGAESATLAVSAPIPAGDTAAFNTFTVLSVATTART
jgi:uncharacterized protein YpuA (DUF1002 family)